jgi:hypothetical protein
MGDSRIKNYTKVKGLVLKGITSPSTIMSQVSGVKNWRTAQNYIREAVKELEDSSNTINKAEEYLVMVESLKGLKSDLVIKMESKTNLNHYLGFLKYIIKIDEQLIKLMDIGTTQPKDNCFEIRMTTINSA